MSGCQEKYKRKGVYVKWKKVLLGNEKYIYQKDENDEEILTKYVIIRGKKSK